MRATTRLAVDRRQRRRRAGRSRWPSMSSDTRPSCGTRPLGDVEVRHDLQARHDADRHAPRDRGRPSRACRRPGSITCMSCEPGSKWMSERPAADRALEHRVDELDDRRLVVGAEVGDVGVGDRQVDLGGVVAAVLGGEVGQVVAEPDAEAVDVVVGGDDRAHRHARDHRHVVDGQHVGRVGHRQQELALVVLADRDRVVAAHEAGVDEPGEVVVDPEHRQVDALDAEALREHARELLRRQDAVLDQHAARQPARLARVHDGALDGLLLREAQLHHDLTDQARRTTTRERGDQAGDVRDRHVLGEWRDRGRGGSGTRRRGRHTTYRRPLRTRRVQPLDGCSIRHQSPRGRDAAR